MVERSTVGSTVKVEVVRTKGARSGRNTSRTWKFIVRRYYAEAAGGGFSLLASGGPFEKEETAQKKGEAAAKRFQPVEAAPAPSKEKLLVEAVRAATSEWRVALAIPVGADGAYGQAIDFALDEGLGASTRAGAVIAKLVFLRAAAWVIVSVGKDGKDAAEAALRIGAAANLVDLPVEAIYSLVGDDLAVLWTNERLAATVAA